MAKKIKKKKTSAGGSIPTVNMMEEALKHHQKGDIETARTLYSRILAIDKDNSDALHLMGIVYYQDGDNREAVEYISKAVKLKPDVSFYHNNLGSALLNLEETEKAAECFRRAISLAPDYAEAYNNLGNALNRQDQPEEAKESYRRAISLNPENSYAHNNLANTYKAGGDLDSAIVHFEKAISLNPDFAEAYFNLASALGERGDYDKALINYNKSIEITPQFYKAYNNKANIHKKRGEYIEALESYKKAIALCPDYDEAYNNLGDAYREMGDHDKAVEMCRKAILINPDSERYYDNLGNALLAKGEFNEAESAYKLSININPDYPEAHYNRSLVLLMKGKLKEGWEEYEWRYKSREIISQAGIDDTTVTRWDGSDLKEKTVLVKSEQGIGDSIQFVRYIPELKKKCGKMIFECHDELTSLLDGMPGIDELVKKKWECDGEEAPDFYIPLLSLPKIFQTDLETIPAETPYLEVERSEVDKWKSTFRTDEFNVGIVWSGNPAHRNDRNRSCGLDEFSVFSEITGLSLYSLQKGNGQKVLKNLTGELKVTDLGDGLHDFRDTASVIMNLDLVISVDTAVVHLAGALGKEVWTLVPFVPDWRWMLEREDTPWYPTMKLFRQPAPGDWKSVFKKAAEILKQEVNNKVAN